MHKKLLIGVSTIIGLFIVIVSFWYIFYPKHNPCIDVIDSSQRADCLMKIAMLKGDPKLCALNFTTLKCLQEVDPEYLASPGLVKDLCALISDTSTRSDCDLYYKQHYQKPD